MTRRVLTPEMSRSIIDLAIEGKCVHDIWLAINREVQKGYIHVIISQARKGGIEIPYRRDRPPRRAPVPPVQNVFTLKLSVRAASILQQAAKRRSMSLRDLAGAILETISNDGIVDAVLDDQTPSSSCVSVNKEH